MFSQASAVTSSNRQLFLVLVSFICLAAGALAPAAIAQPRRELAPPVARHGEPRIVWKAPEHQQVIVRPATVAKHPGFAPPRRRALGPLVIHRPHGPTFFGYGFHYHDEEAAPWIAFTAITLVLLDRLDEEQVRHHEQAQIVATTAPLGEAIVWNVNGASGSVTALREGTDSGGHTCREFRQTVSINGQTETAYGTACQQEDGAWRIVQ